MTKVQWLTRRIAAILSMVLAAGATPAAAADVKVGGVIHGQYGMYASKTNSAGDSVKGKGEFDITRIYLGADAKFSPTVKSKLVLESNGTGNASADTHKANSVFLKQAFMTWTPLESLSIDGGMIPMPWISFEEKIWGRRFVQKTYADQQGTLGSTDKGIGFLYSIPKGYGDVHAVYVNGESYNVQESSFTGNGRYKDAAFRVSVSPMPENEWVGGVKLHMYVHNGQQGAGEAKRRDRYLAGISYQGPKGHLMYSAFKSYQGNNTSTTGIPTVGSINRRTWGQSIHGSVKVCKTASVFGRFDTFSTQASPTSATAHTDAFNRGILGVDYKLAEGVMVSLNDQWLTPLTGVKKNENQILLQFEAKF